MSIQGYKIDCDHCKNGLGVPPPPQYDYYPPGPTDEGWVRSFAATKGWVYSDGLDFCSTDHKENYLLNRLRRPPT